MYVFSARNLTTGRLWRGEHGEWRDALSAAAGWRSAGWSVTVRFWPSLAELS